MWNLALIGSPGSGKSTLAKSYGQLWTGEAQMSVLDIDEAILWPALLEKHALNASRALSTTPMSQLTAQSHTKDAVAAQVQAMTTQQFLEWEAGVTSAYPFEILRNTIVSTTGSNPLRPTVLARIRQFMPIIWIDVPDEIIIERLRTKDPATGIERVTGIKEHGSIQKLLAYRRHFYRAAADLIFIPSTHSSEETVNEFAEWIYLNQVHTVADNWRGLPIGLNFDDRAQLLKVGGTTSK
jgi:shikimate kinase